MSGNAISGTFTVEKELSTDLWVVLTPSPGFEEDIQGSLEPVTLADMIVLSKDILTVDPEEIMGIEIEQTYVGGNLVFQN